MWTDQRFHALRLGGHVLSRHFRYYIPEFSGQIVVQTPIVVRWVFTFFFLLLVLVILRLWLCSRLGLFTAAAPMWTDQRFHALRLGGHVLSRYFRYYIPEFSGRIVVQTPITVRWVIHFIFCSSVWFFLRFRFFVFLLLLVVVVYLMVWSFRFVR